VVSVIPGLEIFQLTKDLNGAGMGWRAM
jgi:hypothetical protein